MTGQATIENPAVAEAVKAPSTVSGVSAEVVKPGIFRRSFDAVKRGGNHVIDFAAENDGPSAMVLSIGMFAGLSWLYTNIELGLLLSLACAGAEIFAMILLIAGAAKTVMDLAEWAEDRKDRLATVTA